MAAADNDSERFIATKAAPPPRARGVLPRPRLNGLVKEIARRRLTVVKAPPGYGKTTLAVAWSDELSALGAAVAWLSLDHADDEPVRLMQGLVHAFARVAAETPTAPAADAEGLLAALLNRTAQQARPVVLFIDDAHHLGSAAALALLALACRRAPPNLHLVLLGRGDAPSALVSQVGPEDLLEVDARRLRFDAAETALLARKLRPQPPAAADIGALHAATEGWPLAVRAILQSLGDGTKTRLADRLAAPNRTLAALFDDLLETLPAELRDFMARIAVVDEVCVCLAAAMTQAADSQRLFDQLGRRQLFFGARDARARWFGFHPLLRDELLRRLARGAAAEVSLLHGRAAKWFAEHELWAEAAGHALLAGDGDLAAEWIEQCAMRLVQSGDLLRLLSWQEPLRHHFLEMPRRLKLAFAWALGHAMSTAEAGRLVDEIEATLGSGAAAKALRHECLALRALIKNVDDDNEAAGGLARRYLARGEGDRWIRNHMLNVVAATHLRAGEWQALHAVPPLAITESDGTPSARFDFNRCYRLCFHGIAEYHQGRLDTAAARLEQAMRLGNARADPDHPSEVSERAIWVLPAALLTQVLYQQNRIDEAAALVGECLEPARRVAPLDFVAAVLLTAARLAHGEGDAARAGELLDDADNLGRARGWIRLESTSLLERVRLCLLAGKTAEAEGCLSRLGTLKMLAPATDIRKAYISRDAFLARAWVDLGRGLPGRSVDGLRKRVQASVQARLPLDAARCAMTLALAHWQLGDAAAAAAAATEACQQAAPAGAVRVLFDLPVAADGVLALLQQCRVSLPSHSGAALFVAGVLAAMRREAADESDRREALETLSSRESLILRLLAQGQSNKEIARALGVAPDTIKYHLKSVFSKLGVGNRAQAAVQAKSFGLA